MSTATDDSHRHRAETLRTALAGDTGITERTLRIAVAARAADGPPIAEPYDDLARQIGEVSYRVTDAAVDAVRQATGSDKAAFEIVMSLHRGGSGAVGRRRPSDRGGNHAPA
jgi:hypothetical protein